MRAARQANAHLSRRVIIAEHSQGGGAALWAASLARSWTPELHVLGTVAFAQASHLAHEARFIKSVSSATLTPFAALITRGVDVAYPNLHIASLLTPRAATLYPQTLTACAAQLSAASSFGGLPLNMLFKQNSDLTRRCHLAATIPAT